MDGLEELQSLSALAKVTEMLKNYLDIDQPELAEFIIHLAKKSKDVEDFNKQLDENEANMSYDFVNHLYRTIIALDPPKKDEWDDIISTNNDEVNFPALNLKNDPNREELKLVEKNDELSEWAKELLAMEDPNNKQNKDDDRDKDRHRRSRSLDRHRDRSDRSREHNRNRDRNRSYDRKSSRERYSDKDRNKYIDYKETDDKYSINNKRLMENEVYYGRVVKVLEFGFFVEFETLDGFYDGFVHVSEISEKRKIINLEQFVKVNDKLFIKVISISKYNKDNSNNNNNKENKENKDDDRYSDNDRSRDRHRRSRSLDRDRRRDKDRNRDRDKSRDRDRNKGLKISLTMKYINQKNGMDNSSHTSDESRLESGLDYGNYEDELDDNRLINSKKRKYMSDMDKWENQQLIKSGVLDKNEAKMLREELLENDEKEEEVQIVNKPPNFLKGQTIRSGIVLSPIKFVAKPEGSLSRVIQSSLLIQKENKQLMQNINNTEESSSNKYALEYYNKVTSSLDNRHSKSGSEFKSIEATKRSLPIYKLKSEIVEKIIKNKILIVIGETGSGKTTQIPQYLYENNFCNYSLFLKLINNNNKNKDNNKEDKDNTNKEEEDKDDDRDSYRSKQNKDNKRIIGITQPRRVSCISVAERVSVEMGYVLGNEVGYSIRFRDKTSNLTMIKYMTDGMLLREILHDPMLMNYTTIMLDEAHERTISTDVLFALLKETCIKRDDFRLIVTSATLESEKFSKYFFGAEIFKIPGSYYPVDIMYINNTFNNDNGGDSMDLDYLELSLNTVLNIHLNEKPGDILLFLTGQEDIEYGCKILNERMNKLKNLNPPPLIILPIYSSLPPEIQSQIFLKSPEGTRKCVLATNIAEASITIDGILYVIDPGMCKVKSYNPKTGMESLIVAPISQANAKQRAGRAGRTAPGKCYRLYSEECYYNEMLPTPIPEIQRVNLLNVVIILKAMGINDFIHFDFMDRPCNEMLIDALDILYHLGALDNEGLLTRMGRKMAQFPLDPTFSKVLLKSIELNCYNEIITIISMLTAQNIFYRPMDKKEKSDQARLKYFQNEGDHLTYLNVYTQWQRSNYSKYYCNQNFLQHKELLKVQETKKQIIQILDKYQFHNNKLDLRETSSGFNMSKIEMIQKSICSGFFHHSAKRDEDCYKTLLDEQNVYIHPSSCLYRRSPEYVIYNQLVLTSKEYMRDLIVIKSKWLLELAPTMFTNMNANTTSKGNKNIKIKPLHNKYNKDQDSWRLSKRRV